MNDDDGERKGDRQPEQHELLHMVNSPSATLTGNAGVGSTRCCPMHSAGQPRLTVDEHDHRNRVVSESHSAFSGFGASAGLESLGLDSAFGSTGFVSGGLLSDAFGSEGWAC